MKNMLMLVAHTHPAPKLSVFFCCVGEEGGRERKGEGGREGRGIRGNQKEAASVVNLASNLIIDTIHIPFFVIIIIQCHVSNSRM
jgi:hypothetical protein